MKQAREQHHVYINGVRYVQFNTYYAVPDDYVAVLARSEPEMLSKGFQSESSDKSLRTFYGRMVAPAQVGDPLQDYVAFVENVRYRTGKSSERYSIEAVNAEGWTGVQVIRWIKQSPFETFFYRCWDGVTGPYGPEIPLFVPR